MSELHKHGRFFDVWARFYRRGPMHLVLQRIQRWALERIPVREGERILDLGCGPGDGARKLAARGALMFGLDYSEGMLSQAKAVFSGRLTRGDACRLPFVDASFEQIICINSFHHYPAHLAALKEMRRVLKPGGALNLVDPRKDHLVGWASIDLIENAVFGLEEVRIFSLPHWHRLLSEAGFASATVEPGPWWSPTLRPEVFVRALA